MNLQMLRAFNEVSVEFLDPEMRSLQAVSRLIEVIRLYKSELSKDQISQLLSIPLNILENDVELSDPTKFRKYGDYFAGNMLTTKELQKYLVANGYQAKIARNISQSAVADIPYF